MKTTHFAPHGHITLCGMPKINQHYISARTSDLAQVTCKQCLRVIEAKPHYWRPAVHGPWPKTKENPR